MREISTWKIAVLSIVATILLLLANISIWLNSNIFDQDNFRNHVAKVIDKEDVSRAIAGELLDQTLENHPIIRQLADGIVKSAVNGMIDSPRFRPVIDRVINEIHLQLTSKDPSPVVLNISSETKFLQKIISSIDSEKATVLSESDFPEEIVLIDKNIVPSMYGWGIAILWIGTIGGLVALGIVIAMFWLADNFRRNIILKTLGLCITSGSLIFLIFISNFKHMLLASLNSMNTRDIVINLYNELLNSLVFQTKIILLIGLLLVAAGFALPIVREKWINYFHKK